jgi:hypothetical protein
MAEKKKSPSIDEFVDSIFKLAKLKSQNKLLGGSISAARQIRGARSTGHTRDDVLRTAGEFNYIQKKGKKKAKGMRLRRKANERKRGR